MSNFVQRYTKTAVILHWLIGLMILGMFALGWYMGDVPKELPKSSSLDLFNLGLYTLQFAEPLTPRTFYFNLHKSFGVTILALVFFRIYWRLTHVAPAMPASMQEWQAQAARIVHKVLYVLMLAMPVSGVAMSICSKYGIKWFGLKLISGLDNNPVREQLMEVHQVLGVILLVVVIMHVGAAFKHKLWDKDEVWKRMSWHG